MVRKNTSSAKKLFRMTMTLVNSLRPEEYEKWCSLVVRSEWVGELGFKMLEEGLIILTAQNRAEAERQRADAEHKKNSNRSKPEEFPERNNLIRKEAARGLTAGQISKLHTLDYEAVRGVINRAKKKATVRN